MLVQVWRLEPAVNVVFMPIDCLNKVYCLSTGFVWWRGVLPCQPSCQPSFTSCQLLSIEVSTTPRMKPMMAAKVGEMFFLPAFVRSAESWVWSNCVIRYNLVWWKVHLLVSSRALHFLVMPHLDCIVLRFLQIYVGRNFQTRHFYMFLTTPNFATCPTNLLFDYHKIRELLLFSPLPLDSCHNTA